MPSELWDLYGVEDQQEVTSLLLPDPYCFIHTVIYSKIQAGQQPKTSDSIVRFMRCFLAPDALKSTITAAM